MSDYAAELGKLAATLNESQREINLARQQCVRPHNLAFRSGRAAIQASRAAAAAFDLGFTSLLGRGFEEAVKWILSCQRYPDDPDRPPATIQRGDWKAEVRSIGLGSGCEPNGMLKDDTALGFWVYVVCPIVREGQLTLKGDTGRFDIPRIKYDDQNRVLGRDVKPLTVVDKIDPESGKPSGRKLDGPIGLEVDDYDSVEMLEYLRCRAADWVDVCMVLVERIHFEAEHPTHEYEVGNARGSVQDCVASSKTNSVRLFGRHDSPIVNDNEKTKLTNAQYDVVLALLRAGEKGLTKDELDRASNRGDARKILGRLSKKDDDWRSVISLPGATGKGYRIV